MSQGERQKYGISCFFDRCRSLATYLLSVPSFPGFFSFAECDPGMIERVELVDRRQCDVATARVHSFLLHGSFGSFVDGIELVYGGQYEIERVCRLPFGLLNSFVLSFVSSFVSSVHRMKSSDCFTYPRESTSGLIESLLHFIDPLQHLR